MAGTKKDAPVITVDLMAEVKASETDARKRAALYRKAEGMYAKADVSAANATVAAAYATLAWVKFDPKGPNGDKSETKTAFGSRFKTATKQDGVNRTTVTLWERIGLSLDKGITPNSEYAETFKMLAWKAYANDATIAGLLNDPKATAKQIVDACARKAAPKEEAKGNGTARTGGTVSTSSDQEIADQVKADPMEVVRGALRLLKSALPALSTEDWAATESALQSLIAKEVTIRTKAAAEAAKKAAPAKKAAAKKVAAKKVAQPEAVAS